MCWWLLDKALLDTGGSIALHGADRGASRATDLADGAYVGGVRVQCYAWIARQVQALEIVESVSHHLLFIHLVRWQVSELLMCSLMCLNRDLLRWIGLKHRAEIILISTLMMRTILLLGKVGRGISWEAVNERPRISEARISRCCLVGYLPLFRGHFDWLGGFPRLPSHILAS